MLTCHTLPRTQLENFERANTVFKRRITLATARINTCFLLSGKAIFVFLQQQLVLCRWKDFHLISQFSRNLRNFKKMCRLRPGTCNRWESTWKTIRLCATFKTETLWLIHFLHKKSPDLIRGGDSKRRMLARHYTAFNRVCDCIATVKNDHVSRTLWLRKHRGMISFFCGGYPLSSF